jgi:hypothetical protein
VTGTNRSEGGPRPILLALRTYSGLLTAAAIAFAYTGYRSSNSVLAALGSSVFGSLLALVALVAIGKTAEVRLKALGLPNGSYPVHVAVVAYVSADPEVVVGTCLSAIRELPNFGSIKEHDSHGYIAAKTRSSWHSTFGERITMRATADAVGTKIRLESSPGFSSVTVDSGLNFQNVALVLRAIDERVGVTNVEPEVPFASIIASGAEAARTKGREA